LAVELNVYTYYTVYTCTAIPILFTILWVWECKILYNVDLLFNCDADQKSSPVKRWWSVSEENSPLAAHRVEIQYLPKIIMYMMKYGCVINHTYHISKYSLPISFN